MDRQDYVWAVDFHHQDIATLDGKGWCVSFFWHMDDALDAAMKLNGYCRKVPMVDCWEQWGFVPPINGTVATYSLERETI